MRALLGDEQALRDMAALQAGFRYPRETYDLPGLIALVVRNLETWRASSRLARLDRHRPHVSPRQGLRKARANIQYHYDLGNDLYRLFLDESMTYSCALWQEGDTLEQAQERKLRAICEKLRLRPGDHVLVPFNIACGQCHFCRQGLFGNCHEANAQATAVGACLPGTSRS